MNLVSTRAISFRRHLKISYLVVLALITGCASNPSETEVRAAMLASSRAVECINTRAKQIGQGQLKVEGSAQIIRLCTNEISTANAHRINIGLDPYPYERWQISVLEALRTENAARRSKPSVSARSKEEVELLTAYNGLRADLVLKRLTLERCK